MIPLELIGGPSGGNYESLPGSSSGPTPPFSKPRSIYPPCRRPGFVAGSANSRKADVGEHRRAGAYRLLRASPNTAVLDRVLACNPCNVPGAGHVHTPEREIISLEDEFALADAMPPRYRLLVLLAAFVTLRWGEMIGLRRRQADLNARIIRVLYGWHPG
jgi:hypothetical protein